MINIGFRMLITACSFYENGLLQLTYITPFIGRQANFTAYRYDTRPDIFYADCITSHDEIC
jgi:hypothetical protein